MFLILFSQFLFHAISSAKVWEYHDFKLITERKNVDFQSLVENIWKISETDELEDVFHDDFKMFACDGKVYKKEEFFYRYIKWQAKPVVENASNKNRKTDKVADVVMKNGRRIGLEFYYASGYYLKTAIVYHCEGDVHLAKFMNYHPIFKAKKLMRTVWQLFKEGRDWEADNRYFLSKFSFETCPESELAHSAKYGTDNFFDIFMSKSQLLIEPKVYDAIEIEEDEKWQFALKWGDKLLQFQMEDVDYYLKITMGREYPCTDYW